MNQLKKRRSTLKGRVTKYTYEHLANRIENLANRVLGNPPFLTEELLESVTILTSHDAA